jgi:hypothetical protein
MRGKLEVLFGGVLLASAMVLAGCVAQTADDDEMIDETESPLVVEESSSGGGDRGPITSRGQDTEAGGDMAGSFKGNEYTTDPQPNPWVPQSPAPPSDPGPNKNQRQAR